ncbi:MAG: winged helix-turn-helix domain-containing protein [Dehalococcoidia bacterium]
MMNVKVVTTKGELVFDDVSSYLEEASITSSEFPSNDVKRIFEDTSFQLILLDMTGPVARPSFVKDIITESKNGRLVGVIGVISKREMTNVDQDLGLDDFVLSPIDYDELITRINILSHKYSLAGQNSHIIKVEDLIIDTARYEVWVGSRQVTLTYKEYELLKLLASEPTRVFTRDALLDQVWGYNYFGGTRTVDVHVRRLRSKLEDSTHTFVETVRNVGYRIRSSDQQNNQLVKYRVADRMNEKD